MTNAGTFLEVAAIKKPVSRNLETSSYKLTRGTTQIATEAVAALGL